MRTRIAAVDCFICGQQDYGPEGANVCITCIAEASDCTACTGPGVTITLYTDRTMTLDIEHAADCPNRAA
jgi:hypothetical protein